MADKGTAGLPAIRTDNITQLSSALRPSYDTEEVVYTVRIKNHTGSNIEVGFRNGFKVPVGRVRKGTLNGKMYITVEVKGHVDKIKELVAFEDVANTSERKFIVKAMKEGIDVAERDKNYQAYAAWEYSYPVVDLLESHEGLFYLPEHDISIRSPKAKRRMVHPFSLESLQEQESTFFPKQFQDGCFVFQIKFVQNSRDKVYSDKYIKLGGIIYKVPTVKDDGLQDGVYIISSTPLNYDGVEPEITHTGLRVYSFSVEEASQRFGLYNSMDEANKGMSALEYHKYEIEMKKLEHQQQHINNQMSLINQKSKAEQRITFWKAVSDGIKVFGAVMAAIVGIFTFIRA